MYRSLNSLTGLYTGLHGVSIIGLIKGDTGSLVWGFYAGLERVVVYLRFRVYDLGFRVQGSCLC